MKEELDLLIREITDKKIVSAFTRIGKVFYDEPSMYFFTANLSSRCPYYEKNGYTLHHHLSACGGAGISFDSERMAIVKSLSEAVERFSGMVYRRQDISFSPFTKLKGHALDPAAFGVDARTANLSWVRGVDLTGGGIACYIPAQLAYLTTVQPGEPVLTVRNSTGTASGFDRDAVLLRGIYEVVERDCYMTAFHNKIPLKKINLESIQDTAVQRLTASCRRYQLGLSLFEMTNDLGIPAYLSILTDKTGIGPAVSAGMKAGFNLPATIRDSIQEAFISRFKMRYEVYRNQHSVFDVKPGEIHDHIARGLYWYPPSRLKEIGWLLGQPAKKFIPVSAPSTPQAELALLLKKLASKGHHVYYFDLTLPNFTDISFYTFKTFIPSLQPLHIDEDDKLLVEKRIRQVARFFGRPVTANQSPHFF